MSPTRRSEAGEVVFLHRLAVGDAGATFTRLAVTELRPVTRELGWGEPTDLLIEGRLDCPGRPSRTVVLSHADLNDTRHPRWPTQLGAVGLRRRDRTAFLDGLTGFECIGNPTEAADSSGLMLNDDGAPRFLNPGGPALSATGPDPSARVAFPARMRTVLDRIAYGYAEVDPATLAGDVALSARLAEVTPGMPAVGYALRGSQACAPLTTLLGAAPLIVYGETGSRKTAVADLVMRSCTRRSPHMAPRAVTMTGKMRGRGSSIYALSQVTYHPAGLPALLDDALTQKCNGKAAEAFYSKLEDLGTAADEQRSPLKGTWDSGRGGLTAEWYPRSGLIVTAEVVPNAADYDSHLARWAMVELRPGDVALGLLDELQTFDAAEALNRAGAGYVAWLMGKLDRARALYDECRAPFEALVTHSRTPSLFARLLAGNLLATAYAVEVGALSPERATQLDESARASLVQAAERQGKLMGARPDGRRVLDPVRVCDDVIAEVHRLGREVASDTDRGAMGQMYPPARCPDPKQLGWRFVVNRVAAAESQGEWDPIRPDAFEVGAYARVPAGSPRRTTFEHTYRIPVASWATAARHWQDHAHTTREIILPDADELLERYRSAGRLTGPTTSNLWGRKVKCYLLDLGPIVEPTDNNGDAGGAGNDDGSGDGPEPEPEPVLEPEPVEPEGPEPGGPSWPELARRMGRLPSLRAIQLRIAGHRDAIGDEWWELNADSPADDLAMAVEWIAEAEAEAGASGPAEARQAPVELPGPSGGEAGASGPAEGHQAPVQPPQPSGAPSAPAEPERPSTAIPASAGAPSPAPYLAGVLDVDGLHLASGLAPAELPAHVGELVDLARRHHLRRVIVHPRARAALGLGERTDPDELAAVPFVAEAEATHQVTALGGWARIERRGTQGEKVLAALVLGPDEHPLTRATDGPELLAAMRLFESVAGVEWVFGRGSQFRAMACDANRELWAIAERTSSPAPVLDGKLAEAANPSWSRALNADEAAAGYVHVYDARSQYLAAAGTAVLPVGEPRQGKRRFDPAVPGCWRIPRPVLDGLPNLAGGLDDEGAHVWLTTPTLAAIAEATGQAPKVTNAWCWPEGKRLLRPWYERTRAAVEALNSTEGPVAPLVLAQIKAMYAVGIGGELRSQRLAKQGNPLYQPAWSYFAKGHAAANLLRRVVKVAAATGRRPFRVDVDSLYYASDEPDPIAGAPDGLPLDGALGHYKVAGSLPLAQYLANEGLPPGKWAALTEGTG